MRFMDIEYLANTMEMFNYTTLISGSAQPKLTKSAILNIELPQPQKDEQNDIMKFIKEISNEIDKSISLAEKEITLTKEYQKSLISEVVTGKMDVREEV
jgi:type I restriction enzyme S subunit